MRVTYRPLGHDFPGKKKQYYERQSGLAFKASWSSTLDLLDKELRQLDADTVIFQIDVREGDIRIDGLPKERAVVSDPAVVVSFQSKYGPLRYSCDLFRDWHINVRAIALGLESLRRVERYGITTRGEQYAGWKALGAGSGPNVGVVLQFSGAREAAAWILDKAKADGLGAIGEKAVDVMLTDKEYRTGKFRQAAMKLHPDKGGSSSDWETLSEARRLVENQVGS